MPFNKEFPHQFITILKICNFSIIFDPKMRLQSILKPDLDVFSLSRFIIFVAYISEGEDCSNLPIFMDLLVFDAVKVPFHLSLEGPS